MTPDKPENPQQGKVGDTSEVEATEAKAAAAEERGGGEAAPGGEGRSPETVGAEQPEPKRTRAKKPAEAEPEEKPKPKGSRAKKTEDGPTAEEVEAKASEEAAESQPAGKQAPKSRVDKDKPETPAPPAKGRGRARKRGATNGQPAEPVLVRAKARYVRTSPRKARLVCDHIRGKDVSEARAILAFTPRGAAKAWIKLLESAVANAEHNHELVGDELRIAAVYADEGPTLKRYRPRAMGRATRIRKRTSHLTITLTPKES